jgi:hypothetical protein
MKMKKLLLITGALCAIPASAFADETLKMRSVYHVIAVQTEALGDVDGHTMSVVRGSGVVLLPDGGGGAPSYFVSTTDYIKGNGPFTYYADIAFSDGSTLWFKGNGQAVVKGNETELKASLAIVGGTGRFAGAKGDGAMTGTRLQALVAAGGEIYNDFSLNIKK